MALEPISICRDVIGTRKRRMTRPWKIAVYWHERGLPLGGDLQYPYCFRCGREFASSRTDAPEDRWNTAGLVRAHLVDHCRGGLGGPQNLMLLCHSCHKVMPSFGAGEGPDAIAWVLRAGRRRLPIVLPGDLRDYPHFKAEARAYDLLSSDGPWNHIAEPGSKGWNARSPQ